MILHHSGEGQNNYFTVSQYLSNSFVVDPSEQSIIDNSIRSHTSIFLFQC